MIMWYVLCFLAGSAVGCFVAAILLGSAEQSRYEDVEEEALRDMYKAMLDEGLSPRTAQRVEKRVRKKGGGDA